MYGHNIERVYWSHSLLEHFRQMCIFHFRIVHKSTKFMLLYAAIHCEQCEVWRSDIWVQYVPDDNCHRALRIYICLHVNRSLNINCCANQTHTVYLINCPNIYLYKKKMYSYFVYAIKIQQYNKYEWYKILGLDYNLVEYFNFHRTISVSFDQLHSIYTPWSNTSLSTYDIQKKKKIQAQLSFVLWWTASEQKNFSHLVCFLFFRFAQGVCSVCKCFCHYDVHSVATQQITPIVSNQPQQKRHRIQ